MTSQDKKVVERSIERAKSIVFKAETVNKAQYTHGINSSIYTIQFFIKSIEELESPSRASVLPYLTKVNETTIKLCGYLYALREGI